MSNQTFSNGLTLTSTANTPPSMETLFQNITAQIFGYDTTQPVPIANNSTNPYWAVRVAWQTQGQPAYEIGEDVCIIRATADDHPFSQCRDMVYNPNDYQSLNQLMSYTQVWRMHWCHYGPNCFDRCRLLISAMSLDWVHDWLAPYSIYAVTEWHRPVYVPELFEGQWWQRADVELQFNELVIENIVVPSAASVNITLVKENGLSETVDVNI